MDDFYETLARMGVTVEYEWCLIHDRALDEGRCLACEAEKPNH